MLKRPIRFMMRFNNKELKAFTAEATRVGLSKVEFARRKILAIPVMDEKPEG
jgi:hypothetical protein